MIHLLGHNILYLFREVSFKGGFSHGWVATGLSVAEYFVCVVSLNAFLSVALWVRFHSEAE